MLFAKLRGYVKVPKKEVTITSTSQLNRFFKLHEARRLDPHNLKKCKQFTEYCQSLAASHGIPSKYKNFHWEFLDNADLIFKDGPYKEGNIPYFYVHKSEL